MFHQYPKAFFSKTMYTIIKERKNKAKQVLRFPIADQHLSY